jgi:chorismate--pyruvate lyase
MNLPVIQAADWCLASCIPRHIIPQQLRDFLLDPGSTTRRMQQEYAAQTKVKWLKQNWCVPHYKEAQHLYIPVQQQALIRETYLSCQGKTWMYARAVFPQKLFTGKTRHLLQQLDSRPLGKLLFSDPTMQRSEFELALLQPWQLEYQWASQHYTVYEALWARRSIFRLQQKPLLLTEVFFPEFFKLVKVK